MTSKTHSPRLWLVWAFLAVLALALSHCQSSDDGDTDGDTDIDGDMDTEDDGDIDGDDEPPLQDGDTDGDDEPPLQDGDTDGDELEDGDLDFEEEWEQEEEIEQEPEVFTLMSGAVTEDGELRHYYGCHPAIPVHNELDSPPLSWVAPPEETKSFVLLMLGLSPESDSQIHWAVINIPGQVRSLPEGSSRHEMPGGSVELTNGWGYTGYGGPCPPRPLGTERDYAIRLFAMSQLAVNLSSTDKRGDALQEEIEALEPLGVAELAFRFANQTGK